MNKKYLTVLSVISSLAVVFLHVNSRIWGYDKTMEWVGANVIECLFYFAVPVFFMISGATFGVYILHYAFLEFYIRPTEAVNHDHILFRTVGTVLLFILCILLTKLIQRIPLIKHLIPS